MPAHHAKSHPLVVANARHSPSYGCALRLDRAPFEDRKSTRLNSSHSQISYAVFCLKKKTPNVSRLSWGRGARRRKVAGRSLRAARVTTLRFLLIGHLPPASSACYTAPCHYSVPCTH